MNLFDMLNRGAAHAPRRPQYTAVQIRAINAARRQWLNALLVDQTRAWLSLGERQPEVLNAMAALLTLAGFVHAYDGGDPGDPAARIMRGAISAATQASRAGGTITAADAQAFSSACTHADAIIYRGTPAAIVHAAEAIRATVGLTA